MIFSEPHILTRCKNNVLVVDDDPLNQAVMSKYLEKLGASYEAAFDGDEAYQKYIKYEEGHFTLIFMDIQMPKLDGISSAKMIRKHEEKTRIRRPGIPIIFISANCSEDERKEIIDENGLIHAVGFFRKPVQYSQFENMVKSLNNGTL